MGAEGYSCFPEPPYQGRTYNVPYNYTECFDEILEPSSQTVGTCPSVSYAKCYFPFGKLGSNPEQSPEGRLDVGSSTWSTIDQSLSRNPYNIGILPSEYHFIPRVVC